MPQQSRKMPLLNRVVVAGLGIGLIGSPALQLENLLTRQEPAPFAEWLLTALFIAAFVPFGVWLVVVSLQWGRKSQAELAEDVEMLSFLQPFVVSDDAVAHHFDHAGGSAAVFVDQDARQIHFVSCHTPSRWLAQASEWTVCGFDELLAVHRQSGEEFELFVPRNRRPSSGEWLTLITASGKAVVPGSSETSYQELTEALLEIRPAAQVPRVMDHPLMMYVVVGGVMVGFCVAAALAGGLSDDQFIVAGIGGAVAGAAGVVAGAWAFDRLRSR